VCASSRPVDDAHQHQQMQLLLEQNTLLMAQVIAPFSRSISPRSQCINNGTRDCVMLGSSPCSTVHTSGSNGLPDLAQVITFCRFCCGCKHANARLHAQKIPFRREIPASRTAY